MEKFKQEGEGRKASASYTIKAYRKNIDKLYSMGLITEEEKDEAIKGYKNAVQRWIGLEEED